MRRLLRIAPLAVLLACAVAQAQITSTLFGDITDAVSGKAIEGAVVVIKSPSLQGEQVAATDATGRYRITLIPLGIYSIHVEATGYRTFDQSNVIVPLGKAIKVVVSLAPSVVAAKQVLVTAKQTATVDQGSTTFGINLEREFLASIPMGRDYESALVTVPTAVSSAFSLVPLGFGGSTGLENVYLIDGLNTANPINARNFGTQLPPEFLEQIQVKVGGYQPEFGRAIGAVVNTVIRSGGNELHGSVFFNYEAQWLAATPETTFTAGLGRRDFLKLRSDAGFTLGGPIVKDKLWFFVGFDPVFTVEDISRFVFRRFEDPANPGRYLVDAQGNPVQEQVARQIWQRSTQSYRFATKLTYAPTAQQRLALSYFGSPLRRQGIPASATMVGVFNQEPGPMIGTAEAGSQNAVLNYLGKFFDKRVQVEATAGYARESVSNESSVTNMPTVSFQPIIQLPEPICPQEPAMTIPTCPTGFRFGLGGGGVSEEVTQRGYLAAKVSFLVPRHQIKFGADIEWNTYRFTSVPGAGQSELWRYERRRDLDGDGAADLELIRLIFERGFTREGPGGEVIRQSKPISSNAFSRNLGVFLQDSWSVTSNLTFNYGLRYERQQLFGSEGPATLEDRTDPSSRVLNSVLTLSKNFAPRAGLIWDPFGDGRTKLYGSFGVYYESIPLALGLFGLDPGRPQYIRREDLHGNQIGGAFFVGGGVAGIQDDIGSQFIYEWIAGIEHEIFPSYRIGLNFLKRTLGNVVEDLSADDGQTYFIGNPGKGPTGAQELARLMQSPGSQLDSRCAYRDPSQIESLQCTGDFPEAVRDYDAWTVFFEKRSTEDQPWWLKFSYTLSFLNGNYTGLLNTDNGNALANLNQQFDIISLLVNRLGFLPTDHRHNIKLYGSYNFRKLGLPGLTVGLGLNALSGAPVTHLGAHELYGANEALIYPRGSAGRLPWLIAPDLFFEYKLRLTKGVTLAFNAVIFNFANRKEPLRVDQSYTFDPICPLRPGQPLSDLRTAAGFDSMTGACIPSDTPATPNPDFRRPTLFQSPISARLGLKLSF